MFAIHTPTSVRFQLSTAALPPNRGVLRRSTQRMVWVLSVAGLAGALVSACGGDSDDSAADQAALVAQGKQVFRYHTFGDETQ